MSSQLLGKLENDIEFDAGGGSHHTLSLTFFQPQLAYTCISLYRTIPVSHDSLWSLTLIELLFDTLVLPLWEISTYFLNIFYSCSSLFIVTLSLVSFPFGLGV